MTINAGYMKINGGTVARTIECGSGVMVDVDADGSIVGLERIGDGDFYGAAYQALRHLRVVPTARYEPNAETPLAEGSR